MQLCTMWWGAYCKHAWFGHFLSMKGWMRLTGVKLVNVQSAVCTDAKNQTEIKHRGYQDTCFSGHKHLFAINAFR